MDDKPPSRASSKIFSPFSTILNKIYSPFRPTVNAILRIIRIDPWWLYLLFIIGIIILLITTSPTPYKDMLVFVSDGLWVTVYVSLITFGLVIILGLFGGLGRLSRNPLIRGIATIYVETIRGIPVLVQLYFWYYAFPSIIQDIGRSMENPALAAYKADAVTMAIFGLAFCYAAYMSEIYRAGIQSISKGQMEAARSLGMSYVQAMRHIIIPQAVRVILPPVGNEFIALIKDSSLISVVAVADMTRRTREFASAKFVPIPSWIMLGLLYLVLTIFSARIVAWIERRTRLEK